jgi:DNA invertase Pin-like site-specific DNA recombinase
VAVVILKGKDCEENIAVQQRSIIRYASAHSLTIASTEIDDMPSSEPLESRRWLKGFLRSLKPKDTVLAYCFESFTRDVGELVKIIECMMKRDIELHIVSKNVIISNQTKPLTILSMLAKQREKNLHPDTLLFQRGRPKGRMSRSKFDDERSAIVSMLSQDLCVNQIAKKLGFSRSSLKDYINTRGLKELAAARKHLPAKDTDTKELIAAQNAAPAEAKECALISTKEI